MLVFTRKTGQSLMIGDEVEIKVVSIGNDQVRVGIEAPRRIPVHRREIYDAIYGSRSKNTTTKKNGNSPSQARPRR